MTADEPLEPLEQNGTLSNEEARLRDALRTTASATPIADGWDVIRRRATSSSVVVPLTPPNRLRPSPARLALAGAAVLLLVAGAVVLASRNDPDPTVRAIEPAATGWYVPVALPEGWTVDAVTWHRRDDRTCPGTNWVWVAPDRTRAVSVDHESCASPRTTPTPRSEDDLVDLGGGITGVAIGLHLLEPNDADDRTISWEHEGNWEVHTVGFDREGFESTARAIVADPSGTTPPARGLELARRAERPVRAASVQVEVGLTSPAGRHTGYELHQPQSLGADLIPTRVHVSGQPLAVDEIHPLSGRNSTTFTASWPGADLRVLRWLAPEAATDTSTTEDDASRADARALVASLRPATADEWHRFVRSATRFDAALTDVDALRDLVDGPKPDLGSADPGDTTTTTTTASPKKNPPEGLEVTPSLATVTVETGKTFEITLRIRNTTDHEIPSLGCLGAGQWGLAPEGSDEPTTWTGRRVRCSAEGAAPFAPGEARSALYRVQATRSSTGDDAPLAHGRFHLVIENPGGTYRLADIPVQVVSARVEPFEPGDQTSTPAHRKDGYGDITDLVFAVEVDDTTVVAGGSITGKLIVHNPTDHDVDWVECTDLDTRWGLVPEADRTGALPHRQITDCYATARVIDPGATFERPYRVRFDGFVARRATDEPCCTPFGGSLAPGRYWPAVEIPGRATTVRVTTAKPVTVIPHPCGGITDKLANAFANVPTLAKARTIATGLGLALLVVSTDGKQAAIEQNLDCRRLRADVQAGNVVHVDLG